MKILFVAAEVQPFIKTGGLGDVGFALPKALKKAGVDCRVILPKYMEIPAYFKDNMRTIMQIKDYFSIEYLEYEGLQFYFVGNEEMFGREGVYGHEDDTARYSLFCRAVLNFIDTSDEFLPDIIHCNDWHSGLIPQLIKEKYNHNDKMKHIKTLFTIHNLKYQGFLGGEYEEGSSFMKLGITYADHITTVSRTYAEEITRPELGEGLDKLLRSRGKQLTGITNGLDTEFYNPETDNDIFEKYNSGCLEIKKENKRELQRYLGLDKIEGVPVIAMVSRLCSEKGFDLVAKIMKALLDMDIQLVILGTGDKKLEEFFDEYSLTDPEMVSCNILFSTKLAKKIYAGSDMFLMPSRYEPCGLSQLIALRYGTVPIVRETGGLKDTVEKYDADRDTGTGFTFRDFDEKEMLDTIKYAISVFKDKEKWRKLMLRGMKVDNSWDNSSKMYIDLYESLL
ncbi:MAG: glycogen synthase [Clostridiaceae bacterium]